MAVLLEHFPGNIEGEVLGVHEAADKAEIIRQQVFTFIHDEDPGGIELQPPLEVLGVEVIGHLGGDKKQSIIG